MNANSRSFLIAIFFLLATCALAAPPTSDQVGNYSGKGTIIVINRDDPTPIKFNGDVLCEVKSDGNVSFVTQLSPQGGTLSSSGLTGSFGPSAGVAKYTGPSADLLNCNFGLSFKGTDPKTKLMFIGSFIWTSNSPGGSNFTVSITAKSLKKTPL